MNTLFKILLFLLILGVPSTALATAGIAEYSYTLDYNQYADIWWGANSDVCSGHPDKPKNCFSLWPKENSEHISAFAGDELLQQISIPDPQNGEFALTQTFFGEEWVIYDLRSYDELRGFTGIVREQEYVDILDSWLAMGMVEPEFAHTKELDTFFDEKACFGLFCGDTESPFDGAFALLFAGFILMMIMLLPITLLFIIVPVPMLLVASVLGWFV